MSDDPGTTIHQYFGIDLGTTFSCISRLDHLGRAEVIDNLDGQRTTPSVVYFASADDIAVGASAKTELEYDPVNGVSLVKRHMNDLEWRFRSHGREWSAPEVSSLILGYLKESAERKTGVEVRGVVITVPAYFGIDERETTRAAGVMAGLNVLGIVNEPTAAAFFYGLGEVMSGGEQESAEQTILIYDLGGGTFDVTVMTIAKGRLTVHATGGDRELGGVNWDQALMRLVVGKFLDENPDAPDPKLDIEERAKLASTVEQTKLSLTELDRKMVSISSGGAHARFEITREEFEDASRDLLGRTIMLTEEVIAAAREKGVSSIDRLLLVGGASKMPAVAARLRESFGIEPELRDPDLAVAQGAALVAAREGLLRDPSIVGEHADRPTGAPPPVLTDDEKTKITEQLVVGGLPPGVADALVATEISNVCSQGFGVLVLDENDEDCVPFLFKRNDSVPDTKTADYFTTVDDQTSLLIRIMEQNTDQAPDLPRPADCKEVLGGEQVFTGIPIGFPRGTPLAVTFEIGADGRMTVTATHPGYAGVMRVSTTTQSIISAEEIEKSRQELAMLRRT